MIKYSKIPQIEKKLCEIENFLMQNGIFLKTLKEIPYGTQILIEGQNSEGKINIYYSDKKGLSVVESPSSDLTQKLRYCIEGQDVRRVAIAQNQSEKSGKFVARIGTDEAGKGDFYGPLITAGFFVDSIETEDDLRKMGVCDSKKLNDKEIAELAKKLHAKYKNNIAIMRPSVEKYNELYSKFKNLNILLGWAHAKVIEELKTRFGQIKLANVDKFADKSLISRHLTNFSDLKIDAMVKGEDNDIAIAAASIIARSYFVGKMHELSQNFGIKIPLGANSIVKTIGKQFIEKHGRENLKYVAKLHFKTAQELG